MILAVDIDLKKFWFARESNPDFSDNRTQCNTIIVML